MEQSAEQARAALDRLEAEQYQEPPEHRAAILPRLIQQARVRAAETELDAVTAELEALEAGEGARQDELSRTAAELARARRAHDAAREQDSAARQRIGALKAGIRPHAENVLAQLTNTGQ